MKLMLTALLAAIFGLTEAAHSTDWGEVWTCKSYSGPNKSGTQVHAYGKIGARGKIQLGNHSQDAKFHVTGLELRWDFGLRDDGKYDYAFVIFPNGSGYYYDFSMAEKSRSAMTFDCKRGYR